MEEPIILEEEFNLSDSYTDPSIVKANIINLLYNGKDRIRLRFRVGYIEDVIKFYYNILPNLSIEDLDRGGVYSYLIPVEGLEAKSPKLIMELSSVDKLREYSSELSDIFIGAYDSSWHIGGAHFTVSFVIYNTGYYYYSFGGDGGSGSHPKLVIGVPDDWDNDLEIKKHEANVVKMLVDRIGGNRDFMFMDESLNLLYSVKWGKDKRISYSRMVIDILNNLISYKVCPLGIFYTKSRDISRTIVSGGVDLDVMISDKLIFDRILEVGERSPLFKVFNSVLDTISLDLYTFYLKLGPRNILRVEFPSSVLNFMDLDDIHIAVYIDALRGFGYPYSLMRAHEMAVLNYEDREAIEDALADILGIPPDLSYSMKQYSKWWSVA